MGESVCITNAQGNQHFQKKLQVTFCRGSDSKANGSASASSSTVTKRHRRRRRGVLSNKKAGSGVCQRCQCRLNSSSSFSLSASSSQLHSSTSGAGGCSQASLLGQQSLYHQRQQLVRLKANNQDLARENAALLLDNQRLAAEVQKLRQDNLILQQRVARLPDLRSNLMGVLDSVYRCVDQLNSEQDASVSNQTVRSSLTVAVPTRAVESHHHPDDDFVDEEGSDEAHSLFSRPVGSVSSPPRLHQQQQQAPQVRVVAAAPSTSVIAEVSASAELGCASLTTLNNSMGEEAEAAINSNVPTQPAIDENDAVCELAEPPEGAVSPPAVQPSQPQPKQRKTTADKRQLSKSKEKKPSKSKSERVNKSSAAEAAAPTKRPARSTRRPVSYAEGESDLLASPESQASSSAASSDRAGGRQRSVMAVQKAPGQIQYLVAVDAGKRNPDDASKIMPPPPPPPPPPNKQVKGSRKRRLASSESASVGSSGGAASTADPQDDPFNLSANRTANLSALPDSLQGLRERCQNIREVEPSSGQPPPVAKHEEQKPANKKSKAKKVSDGKAAAGNQTDNVKKKNLRRQQQQQQAQLNESDDADFVSLY